MFQRGYFFMDVMILANVCFSRANVRVLRQAKNSPLGSMITNPLSLALPLALAVSFSCQSFAAVSDAAEDPSESDPILARHQCSSAGWALHRPKAAGIPISSEAPLGVETSIGSNPRLLYRSNMFSRA